jgi:hypothetical protein
MALVEGSVNLWKTLEVSQPQTLSNGTGTDLLHSVDYSARGATNMVLDTSDFQRSC